ncbi:MAG: cytochrome P450 [Acidimicrobiia bacterium]
MTSELTPTGSDRPGSLGPLPQFDPFADGFAANPYPQYRELSTRNPVHRTPLGIWTVFSYDDCARLLRDPTLSVEDTSVRGANPQAELRAQAFGERALRGRRGILNIDPPDHTRIRQIMQKVFTPRAIEQLGDRVQALTDAAIDDALGQERDGGGPIDLIGALAFPLPFQVISEMLGMPDGDRDQLREWSHTAVLFLEPTLAPFHLDEIAAASDRMLDYLLDAIEWKRANPADDLLTALVDAEHEGERLSTDELVDQVRLLFIAGHETTVNLIGNGTLALLRNRGELERWRRDPSIGVQAVDELLRYDSPVQFSRRVTTADLDLGEHGTAEAGAFVILGQGAANHDPAHWGDDADSLDLTRPGAARHLSFGGGIHHCLGAALARLEGRVAIGTLVQRCPQLALAVDEPAWNGRMILRGLESLPVSLTG